MLWAETDSLIEPITDPVDDWWSGDASSGDDYLSDALYFGWDWGSWFMYSWF